MPLIPRRLVNNFRDGRIWHFAGALAARAMEAAGKFGLYMLAARLMGGTESGFFFLCLTWTNLCTTLARMGLERAMSRHIAAELAIGNGTAARRVLMEGLGWTALASSAAAILTFVLSRPIAVLLFGQPALAHPLAIAAFILPPQTMAFAIGFALIGLNRGIAGQMVQSALPPVLSLVALLAGLNQIDRVLEVYAGSYTICCIPGLALIARDWRHVMVERFSAAAGAAERLPTLWVTARPFLVIEMVQVSLLSAPVLLLGVVGTPVAVSAFSIISRLTNLINTILLSVTMIAAPAFAAHHRRQEYAALRAVERHARMVSLAICLPVIGGLLVFAHPLLSLMHSDMSGAASALFVLMAGQFVNTLLPTQDMVLSMTGHGDVLRRLNLQQLFACLALCAALIPPFGMMGAAIASSVCLIQGRVSFALAVRRVLPLLSAATMLGGKAPRT
ncbi:MAG TPA: lipopolysaccharide biosynthesis protein [Rhodopila sp.]|nr:lipopolysaccharide biosynthesis protein [Rhodopila sp.]